MEVYPVTDLASLVQHLQGGKLIVPQVGLTSLDLGHDTRYPVAFEDVKGQEIVKRALEFACAGGHNVSTRGSSGVGKTQLARASPSTMPKLDFVQYCHLIELYRDGLVQTNRLCLALTLFSNCQDF